MSFPSTNQAPLALTARRDVLATAVPVAGRSMWVVKDPITLAQHELGEEEYLLLSQLDGPTSLAELQQAYQRRFAPRTIQPAEIHAYLGQLHRAGLLVSRGTGQATALADRDDERRAARWRWSWTELLAMRLRGVNPDRWLDALSPFAAPLLQPMALLIYAGIILVALALLATHFEEFLARLPGLESLVAPGNWFCLILVVAVVKVLHELAHALVAKRMGAEVHEMGILFLVFVPTLYCDVTDIWNLPGKWQRMAVSAAGMGIELLLAALATFVWWFSEPGLVNLLALNTMVVASVGTLLVNANPLMRYDGYYLLADLCETPNLWQRSRDAWQSRVSRLFFKPAPNTKYEPVGLAIYGGLSSAYMMLVLGTIFWAMLVALQPLGFGVVAYGVGTVMLSGVVAGPVRKLGGIVKHPVRRGQFRPLASSVALLLAAVIVAGIWRWPLADRVECRARVAPVATVPLVATLAGRVQSTLPPGSLVDQGDVVATLTSDEVALAEERLTGELRLAELQVQQLEALRVHDPEAASRLPTARAARGAARERLAEHQKQAERLVLRAAKSGVVLPPPDKPEEGQTVTLATWTGTPLEAINRGAWIEPGTLVALVADYGAREVALAIDETDIELVAPGQRVRVQLDGWGPTPLYGTIRDISQVATSSNQRSAAPFAPRWGEPATEATPRYEARVVLDRPALELPIDSGGRAKVEAGETTVGTWLVRELSDTFRLP